MILSTQDLAGLAHSGISRELAEAAGLRRVNSSEGAEVIGRNGIADYSGILFPYCWPGDQHPREYRLRRDHPDLEEDGSGGVRERNKYLSPPGAPNMLYFPPDVRPAWLSDPSLSIILTEGEKKTLALSTLSQHDLGETIQTPRFMPVGLAGVWCWRGRVGTASGPDGDRRNVTGVIGDFDKLTWKGRRVTILFDVNVGTNVSVQIARQKLAAEMERRGAIVSLFDWPDDVPEGVNGIDDLLGLWGPDEILRLLSRTGTEANPTRHLQLSKNGRLLANLNNAVFLLENDPALQGLIWFDEFVGRLMTGDPPREWADTDDINLTLDFQSHKGIPSMRRDTVSQAVIAVAFQDRRNCVKDWLDSLTWDGESRIDQFFENHFGAEATEYTRAASKNFWLSIVARVFQPGCQADHMPVLEGPQGAGKSAGLRAIGGDWFTEQHESATGKGFFEVLQGKLLVEISEMDAFSRADVTRVKQVLTCLSDRYREPYGRHAKDHPRQCVFVGTTNRDDWNRDETGARRFWPIACHGEIDVDAIRSARSQLFAEAVVRFHAGETWWEMPIEETRRQQADRYSEPSWAELILRYINSAPVEEVTDYGVEDNWVPRTQPLTEVSIPEILEHALKLPTGQWHKGNEMRLAEALRFLGWTKKDVRREGRVVKRWFPPEVATGPEVAT